jgi:hypothetical protein
MDEVYDIRTSKSGQVKVSRWLLIAGFFGLPWLWVVNVLFLFKFLRHPRTPSEVKVSTFFSPVPSSSLKFPQVPSVPTFSCLLALQVLWIRTLVLVLNLIPSHWAIGFAVSLHGCLGYVLVESFVPPAHVNSRTDVIASAVLAVLSISALAIWAVYFSFNWATMGETAENILLYLPQ